MPHSTSSYNSAITSRTLLYARGCRVRCPTADTGISGLVAENDKGKLLWDTVVQIPSVWLIVDLHQGDKYVDRRPPCKVVVTSTLRKGNWPDLDNGGDTLSCKLFMGPLSHDEAKSINNRAGLVNLITSSMRLRQKKVLVLNR